MSTRAEEKARLRSYLNPSIKGPNVDNVLDALAGGPLHLINNVEAINSQLYIVSAEGQYLDQLLAGRDITRPDNVGLSDTIFRELGVAVSTRKQVRDLVHEILRIMYGEEFVRATVNSTKLEPYALADGDTLIISYDDQTPVEVTFTTGQFANITAATGQEVADAITKEMRRLGSKGSAIAKDDGVGGYPVLISETNGPTSTVRVLGGKAQNKLQFAQIRPTGGVGATQWTITQGNGGVVRATWSGGPDPKIGKVQKDDYVNLYGTAFNIANRGTFTITAATGGLINASYVEWVNPAGVAEITAQGNAEGILFFNPERKTINSKTTWASAYQTQNRLLEVFVPATTKVIRRDRAGAAHLHDTGASAIDQLGPYVFDPAKPYIIGGEECNTTQVVDSSSGMIISVDNSAPIPDTQGYLVFGFGTAQEEIVPYISRPSTNSLMINPSYVFKYVHSSGTNISLVALNNVYNVASDASDFPFYATDVIAGRVYAQDLINLIVATGINVVITVLYPSDIGLGKFGTQYSEKFWVWGPDLV